MFRFSRKKILPLFLQRRITVTALARQADVAYNSAAKAVQGEPVAAHVISKVAEALGIEPYDFLEPSYRINF